MEHEEYLLKGDALVVVDMQCYYLSNSSHYFRYFNELRDGCLSYLLDRCNNTVIPNIALLLERFRQRNRPVVYLRLCGREHDRSDLHRFFRDTHHAGIAAGYDNIYPLCDDPMAQVIDALSPLPSDTVFDKTTFSPFTSEDFADILRRNGITTCVFTGLATSQCVETTARDASDRGFNIIHIEDCQADYEETSHLASLYSSQGVCGGQVFSTEDFLSFLK